MIERYTEDRGNLVLKGSETRVQRLVALNDAAEKVRGYLRYFANQEQSLLTLKDEVVNLRTHQAPETLRKTRDHAQCNLVVNTDADQIIVASVGPHRPGQLPPISYLSGGLESAQIQKAVCDILEGGERAFQERARRLRVQLDP